MTTSEEIRLHYPLPIARVYETAQLETEPRQRVRKLIDLYERTAQYLVLAGLACCAHLEASDPQVEALRPGLERPSLGHWVELLKALSRALRAHGLTLLTAQPGRAYQDDGLSAAMGALAQVLDASLPKKILLHHFLDTLVEYRNKRIGHGVLSLPEARAVVAPLEAGLVQWLGELELLHRRHLVHVAHVEWQPPRFAYSGTHLNAGVSLYPIALQGDEPLTPERVYLHDPETEGLIPLHPFFHYDSDVHLLYAYSELDAQGRPLLRCPYEAPGAEGTYTLDLEGALILGSWRANCARPGGR